MKIIIQMYFCTKVHLLKGIKGLKDLYCRTLGKGLHRREHSMEPMVLAVIYGLSYGPSDVLLLISTHCAVCRAWLLGICYACATTSPTGSVELSMSHAVPLWDSMGRPCQERVGH